MQENHRVATIFAGILTLIQSILWALIAIYSVAVYGCQADYPFTLSSHKYTASDLLYVSYYYAGCRAEPGQPTIEAPSAVRTYYLMLTYGVISSIWIPTSVLLLVAVINKIKGKYGSCLFLPWIINTSIIIVIDLCATVVYAIDISHTLTVRDYADFVKPLPFVPRGADGITVIPAIELTVYFSRGIIFWILNFVLLGVVIQAAVQLKKMVPTSAFIENEARRKVRDDNTSQWINMKAVDDSGGMKHLPRLYIEDNSPTPSRSPQLPISPQSPTTDSPPLQMRPQTRPPPPPAPPIPSSPESSLNRGNSSPVYDVYGKHIGNELPEEIPHRHTHLPTNDTAQISGLSNQVPWSYAQLGELNLRLKQTAAAQQERAAGGSRGIGISGRKPQIPEPDYTIHFQQTRRSVLPHVENLSRSNSTITTASSYVPDKPYYDNRWNPRKVY